jgi:HD-like signal output (HDOD) protein
MSLVTSLDRAAILSASTALPTAPQIMARLYRLLLDFNSGLRAITDLLKRDPALTARVIRIANSPAFGGGGIASIEDALSRVGFGEVYRLVGSASNDSLGAKGLRCYGFAAEAYQRHNLYGALVAERLAQLVGEDARAAYTAGLLRRIGQLLLDQVGASQLPASETFRECGAGRAVEWERRTFGITHHEVAGILMTEWGFPAEVVDAVRHGHGEAGEMSRLARVIDLTDNIVRLAGLGLADDQSEWGLPTEKLAALGLDHDAAQRVKDDALAVLRVLEQSQQAA